MLDINHSDSEVHSGRSDLLPFYRSEKQCQLHTTCSGKIFTNKSNYSNSELQARLGKQSKKRRGISRNLLKRGDRDYWGRLRWDVILLKVSECQIYQGRDTGRFCDDTCQLRLHYQWAKYYRPNINQSPRSIIRTHLTIIPNHWYQLYRIPYNINQSLRLNIRIYFTC